MNFLTDFNAIFSVQQLTAQFKKLKLLIGVKLLTKAFRKVVHSCKYSLVYLFQFLFCDKYFKICNEVARLN